MTRADPGAVEFQKRLAEALVQLEFAHMPFGRYGPERFPPRGVPLVDLPAEYLAFFAARGFPRGRLGELIETRQHTRRLSGAEALRQIQSAKYPPGAKPKSAAELVGELRAMRAIWELEDAEAEHRDPHRRLAELRAKQVPPWAVE